MAKFHLLWCLDAPDTLISDIDGRENFNAGGIKFQLIEAMRKWRIVFNGLAKRVRDGEQSEVHLRINMIWTAFSRPYEIRQEFSRKLLAAAMAREMWRGRKEWWRMRFTIINFINLSWGTYTTCISFNCSQSNHDGVDQWGVMAGTFQEGSQDEEKELYLRGLRQRRWGQDYSSTLHRWFWFSITKKLFFSENYVLFKTDFVFLTQERGHHWFMWLRSFFLHHCNEWFFSFNTRSLRPFVSSERIFVYHQQMQFGFGKVWWKRSHPGSLLAAFQCQSSRISQHYPSFAPTLRDLYGESVASPVDCLSLSFHHECKERKSPSNHNLHLSRTLPTRRPSLYALFCSTQPVFDFSWTRKSCLTFQRRSLSIWRARRW